MSLPRRNSLWKWLRPGLHIKRWVVLLAIGFLLCVAAGELLLFDVLRSQSADLLDGPFSLIALWHAREIFATIGVLFGLALIVAATIRLNQSLLMEPAPSGVSGMQKNYGPALAALGCRWLQRHELVLHGVQTVRPRPEWFGRLCMPGGAESR